MHHTAVVLMFTLVGTAHAATTAPIGQPFCTTSQGLHEYLLVLARRTENRPFEIEGCAVLKGGIEIEVVEKGKVVGGMHVDRVRITGLGTSLIGWTLNFD